MGSSDDSLERAFGQSRSKNQVGEAAGCPPAGPSAVPSGQLGALCAVGLGVSELVLTDFTAAQPAPRCRCPDGTGHGVWAPPRPSPHAHLSPTARWVSLPSKGQPSPRPCLC